MLDPKCIQQLDESWEDWSFPRGWVSYAAGTWHIFVTHGLVGFWYI